MMIRSQDRKKLYPLTNGLYYDGGTSVLMDLGFSVDGTGDLLLGTYNSEARCLEILDEIQQMYQSYLSCDGGNPYLMGSNGYPPFAFNQPKVFEMPKK